LKTFIRILSRTVRRAPVAIIIGAVAITMVLGAFTSQQQQASGNEGFSPDSEESLAGQTIDEVFTQNAEVTVQVVFEAGSGDVLTAEAVTAYTASRTAVFESRASEILARGEDSVFGFLDPLLVSYAERGIDAAGRSDAQVKQDYLAALDDLPAELGEQARGLVSSRFDAATTSAPSGLMVVFLTTPEDDEDLSILQEIEVDMADRVRAAAEAASGDVSAQSFSFALLFADQDAFQEEIGRLFAAAGYIILIILLTVFIVMPKSTPMLSLMVGGFVLLGGTTLLMVLEILPIWAPAAAIVLVLGAWSLLDRGLRRSAADTIITLLVIVMSISWMNGIGVLLGPGYLGWIGAFNEILQIIPILLIGLGVDYAIHLTSRYREEMGSGATVVEAATRASRTVGVALVLATVTTAVGFLTNLASPVTAIADFGVLATVGIGSAFILMLTFVPALRIVLDRRAERRGIHPIEEDHDPGDRLLPMVMGRLSVLAEHVPVVTLTVALALGALGGYGLTRLDTTFSFTDFVSQESPLLDTIDTLNDDFGGGRGERTQVLITGDVATPEVHNAIAAAYGNMLDTPDVSSFAGNPSADSPLSVLAALTIPPESETEASFYDPEFAALAAGLGLQPDLTVAPGGDVAALYDAASERAPDAMRRVVARGDDGAYRYVDVSIETTAGEARAGALADGLAEDFAPVSGIEGVSAVATNENIISDGVVKALQSSQASSLALTILAAMLLLIITFYRESRRPFLGVITIAPVALVVLWVFGAMVLSGISFNPVTAMIAAIAIGIGVPYSIHITHRYQEDRLRHDDPDEAIRSTMTHTGGALAGSALTTVAGFGILVTSTLKPFQQFGIVVGYAIGFALIAAVLVLPSMLILWDRWHLRRGESVVDEEQFARARVTNGEPPASSEV